MTDKEKHDEEGTEETIEDLEAPADAQGDVAGGAGTKCPVPGVTTVRCAPPSCTGKSNCAGKTTVVFEQ